MHPRWSDFWRKPERFCSDFSFASNWIATRPPFSLLFSSLFLLLCQRNFFFSLSLFLKINKLFQTARELQLFLSSSYKANDDKWAGLRDRLMLFPCCCWFFAVISRKQNTHKHKRRRQKSFCFLLPSFFACLFFLLLFLVRKNKFLQFTVVCFDNLASTLVFGPIDAAAACVWLFNSLCVRAQRL